MHRTSLQYAEKLANTNGFDLMTWNDGTRKWVVTNRNPAGGEPCAARRPLEVVAWLEGYNQARDDITNGYREAPSLREDLQERKRAIAHSVPAGSSASS